MAEFNKAVTTQVGLDLFTNIIASSDKIEFTKIVTSTNIYPENQILDLQELNNVKQEALISNIIKEEGNQVKIQAIVSNENLVEDYTINTVRYICKRK